MITDVYRHRLQAVSPHGPSIVSWLMIVHALRAKIRVSNFISRTYGQGGEVEFRIKMQNGLRWRSAVDLRLDAYVWLPGHRRPTSNELIPVDIDGEEFVGLRPGHRKVVRLSVNPDRGVRRASFHRYTYGDIAAVMFDERSVGRGRPAVKSGKA